jgi:tetratricopeptide (TPR) repeat protein
MASLLVLAIAFAAVLAVVAFASSGGPLLPEIRRLWDFDDPAASEARFRAAIPTAQESGNRAYLCELTTQLARAQGLQMKFAEADRTLDQAEALLGEGMARARVLCLLERGRVRNSDRKKEEAKPFFVRAWDEARAAGLGGLAVDAAHMAAIAEPPERALRWNEEALEFAERSEDEEAKRWIGTLCNNSGWEHHKRGEFDQALMYFEKALIFAKERGTRGSVGVAEWCVARCLRSLGRTEEALRMLQDLRARTEAAGEPDGYVYEELGECLWAVGRRDEGRPWLGKAWEILSRDRWLARDEPERIARLKRLSGGAEA